MRVIPEARLSILPKIAVVNDGLSLLCADDITFPFPASPSTAIFRIRSHEVIHTYIHTDNWLVDPTES